MSGSGDSTRFTSGRVPTCPSRWRTDMKTTGRTSPPGTVTWLSCSTTPTGRSTAWPTRRMEWQRLSGRSFRRARRRSRPRPRAPSPTPCCSSAAAPAGYAIRATGRCTTDTSPNRDGRPSSCGYEPPRNASPPHRPNFSTGFISTAQRRECRSRSTRSVHSDRGSRRHRATAPQLLSPTSPGILSGSRHCSKRCNTSST